MPSHLTGIPPDSTTWHELEDVFAGLSQIARTAGAPDEFYGRLLEECVRSLSAVGGAVWLRVANGAWQPVAQHQWPAAEIAGNDGSRRAHEALLTDAALRARIIVVAPQSADIDSPTGNPTPHVLLLGPVQFRLTDDDAIANPPAPSTVALIELLVRADASPAAYRGYEQFLTSVCDVATDYHAFAELRRLRQTDEFRQQLLQLGRDAHRTLNLSETAYTVANEGRRVLGCDRLSVLVARGRRCRLLATSGVGRVERRSGVARRLEKVADLVRRTDEPAFYDDGQCDGLPPVAEALEKHAEESHARQVAAIPLRRPTEPDDETAARKKARRKRHEPPQCVLVAEQFDARQGQVERERLVEVAEICTTALYNSLEVDRQPLGWLVRPLGAAVRLVTGHLARAVLAVAALGGLIAALIYVPADFTIEAPGALQPAVRRDVFAPRSGLVDEVLVQHAANVTAGQPLVRLRDPSLELELKRVSGELETVQRQLDAVRATRTTRAVRDTNPTDTFRLSAEERELDQKLSNLERERELLNQQRESLVVTSPIAGRVLTWDVAHRLMARPVERGDVLVTVADLSANWQLELDVPDDQIGHVLAARQELQPALPVRFRLSSDDREQHTGHIAEVCTTADVAANTGSAPKPSVMVKVALDTLQPADIAGGELQPGVSARAQIECGRRALGYVWLHDIWDAAIGWLRF